MALECPTSRWLGQEIYFVVVWLSIDLSWTVNTGPQFVELGAQFEAVVQGRDELQKMFVEEAMVLEAMTFRSGH